MCSLCLNLFHLIPFRSMSENMLVIQSSRLAPFVVAVILSRFSGQWLVGVGYFWLSGGGGCCCGLSWAPTIRQVPLLPLLRPPLYRASLSCQVSQSVQPLWLDLLLVRNFACLFVRSLRLNTISRPALAGLQLLGLKIFALDEQVTQKLIRTR